MKSPPPACATEPRGGEILAFPGDGGPQDRRFTVHLPPILSRPLAPLPIFYQGRLGVPVLAMSPSGANHHPPVPFNPAHRVTDFSTDFSHGHGWSAASADATSRAGEGKLRRAGLRKGTVLQPSGPRRVFKGLGVAKRYCRIVAPQGSWTVV